jgi:hypothetical protein
VIYKRVAAYLGGGGYWFTCSRGNDISVLYGLIEVFGDGGYEGIIFLGKY